MLSMRLVRTSIKNSSVFVPVEIERCQCWVKNKFHAEIHPDYLQDKRYPPKVFWGVSDVGYFLKFLRYEKIPKETF